MSEEINMDEFGRDNEVYDAGDDDEFNPNMGETSFTESTPSKDDELNTNIDDFSNDKFDLNKTLSLESLEKLGELRMDLLDTEIQNFLEFMGYDGDISNNI